VRRIAKIDANQPEIVQALRKAGARVTTLHRVGGGVADLLVSFRRAWFLLEIKNGAKPPSKRKLTPDEARWIAEQEAVVHVVESTEQALQAIGVRLPNEAWREIV